MTKKVRVAIAQINPTVGDLTANRNKIKAYIEKAKKVAARIVVFPELAVCGCPPEGLLQKPNFIKDNIKALRSLIKCTHNITAVVGFADTDEQKNVYSAAAVIRNGKLKGIYRKDEDLVFHLGGFTLGVDVSALPYHKGKSAERHKLLSDRARKAKIFLCYANLVGGQDELVFDGRSEVLDPKGKTIASGEAFEEDLVLADLGAKTPAARSLHKKLSQNEEIYKALVLGTRDYVRKNGFEKVVLGLSGGIDSSLTVAIACDAVGKKNVAGILMPSRYSSIRTRNDARKVAANLGIKVFNVPINSIFDAFMKTLNKSFSGKAHGITEENLQARIRGNILMAFSNRYGWLVLTTGNKSETAVGYCTLYGDMAGGFSVIKDVPKTLVYELADLVNKSKGKAVIPRSVITRPPSAELKPRQKDTDSIPSYDLLDQVLKAYVEEGKSFDRIKGKKLSTRLLKKVINMVDRSEYKRRQAPPGVKITPEVFEGRRRLPITNQYDYK